MKVNRIHAALVFAAASAVSACHCNTRSTGNAFGVIGIVYTDTNGTVHTDTNATYDFGAVFMGQTATNQMVIKNLGAGPMTLTVLSKTDGDAVQIGGAGDPNPVFTVDFTAESLDAAQVGTFKITFSPPQESDPTIQQKAHKVVLQLTATGTAKGAGIATITLQGLGVAGVCGLPSTLDFGSVEVGDSYTLAVDVQNPSKLDATASVGAIYGSDSANFTFTIDSPQGNFIVPAGSTKTVRITFSPTQARSYAAFVKMQASAQCPEVAVVLQGSGVNQILSWNPATVDCGDVQPGVQVTQPLTFTNAGNVDVNLTQIQSASPVEFYVVAEPGQDPTQLTVPGKGGTASLTIGCKPSVLGPRSTNLTFNTSLPKQPAGSVPLKAFGGGPQIQAIPYPNLNFGQVAYFAGATPASFQSHRLTVMNIGAQTPDPKGNLYLGKVDANGNWVAPYVDVTPSGGTQAGEITVTVPSSYDPSVGLPAVIGQNAIDLTVTVTPASAGNKAAVVTIHSNDPANPDLSINVTANAVTLPPCNYAVSPTTLDYGLVTPPQHRDLTFNITNLGTTSTETCLLSNLDLAPNSDPSFSLPAGPISSYTMQPGETKQISVRAWPQGQVPPTVNQILGQVQFYMSSPSAPQGAVNLKESVGSSCLTIAPASLNFGTVQQGCNSSTRSFSIYNTCSSPVTINSFTMQSAAGQPAGGPNCPGTSPCPEFFIVSTPAIPSGGLVVTPGASPYTLQAKYAPIDIGQDQGAIAIAANQFGSNVTYLINLSGDGDTQGLNTDTFVQSAKPKADILICDDSSCSMTDNQTALAQNFDSFLQYATATQVDFQIGVITEETQIGGCTSGNLCDGQLINYLNEGLILTPNTANLSQKFSQKVQVQAAGHETSGGLEQCITTSTEAVTAPMVTGPNAGFLRPDATLAIVSVSDSYDQGTQPVTYYLNQLLNAKGNQPNSLTFNSIGDFSDMPMTTPGCSYEGGESPDNGRYLQMVNSTNGVRGGVCDANWSTTLKNIGKTAFGFRTNFYLNATPDLSGGKQIIVTVDGQTVPQTDSRGSTIWSYDPTANSVDFDPLYVPQPGQTMTITYYVACN